MASRLHLFVSFLVLNLISFPSEAKRSLEIDGFRVAMTTNGGRSKWESDPTFNSKKGVSNPSYETEMSMFVYLKKGKEGTSGNKSNIVLVDHVFDETVGSKVKLLNPMLIHLKENYLLWDYSFNHYASVNNKPYEAVYHHEAPNSAHNYCDKSGITYSACTEGNEPSGKPGFCCSCQKGNHSSLQKEVRGGQNCVNSNVDISIHCLKFDPLWYSVNNITQGSLEYGITVGLFSKVETSYGKSAWKLLNGQGYFGLQKGSDSFVSGSNSKRMSAQFKGTSANLSMTPLHPSQEFILTPEPLAESNPSVVHPQILGGRGEFLIVSKDSVNPSGVECNKIGVNHAAFINQENKCHLAPQSCLNNQPATLWSKDMNTKDQTKRKYFLSSRGTLMDTPISLPGSTAPEKSVQFVFEQGFKGTLEVNISTEELTLLHPGSHAVLSEVSSWSKTSGTLVFVDIHNQGLVSENITLELTCPNNMGNFRATDLKFAPHQSKKVKFSIGVLRKNSSRIACAVKMLNHRNKVTAYRTVVMKILDRCFCLKVCACTCMSEGNFKCEPMEGDAYRQAGFRRHIPNPFSSPHMNAGSALTLEIISIVILILLLLGIFKMIIGRYLYPQVGKFGLHLFQDSTEMAKLSSVKEGFLNTLFFFYMFIYPLHFMIKKRGGCRWIREKIKIPALVHRKKSDRSVGDREVKVHRGTSKRSCKSVSRTEYMQLPKSPKHASDIQIPQCSNDSSSDKPGKINNNIEATTSYTREKLDRQIPQCSNDSSSDKPGKINNNIEATTSYTREKLDRQATIQHFRRQKRFLKQLSKSIKKENRFSSHGSSITTASPKTPSLVTSSMAGSKEAQRVELGDLCILTTDQKAFIHQVTSKARIFLRFSTSHDHLQNSGCGYSLCGYIRQQNSKFQFHLGSHTVQLYEVEHGEVKELPSPRPLNPEHFQCFLNMTDVLTRVSTELVYPCLNFKQDS